ncbi:MAG: hypothetical protein ACREMF_02940 [Gemmatimonadales bacterium]
MSGRRDWLSALYAAGVTPASFVPDASLGRVSEPDEIPGAGVELVEDAELRVHEVTVAEPPGAVTFLDGIQQWRIVGYAGVQPIAVAYVAAAARRRGPDRRLVTVASEQRALVIASRAALGAEPQAAIASEGMRVVLLEEGAATQPGQVVEALRREVHRARHAVEKGVGERILEGLTDGEWLVLDGQLSVSAALARHPRALGVIKSHGAQFLEGRHLERALTLPAAHRTSVFRVLGGHGRTAVDSWYVRLWPWEGNDLQYGLLRIEARAHAGSIMLASEISGWLLGERAPLATPDARFDRLLYPIHEVETYLRSRAPRELAVSSASRLPRTGT